MIVEVLKVGGIAGLVLPAGVFNNPSMQPLRSYIRKTCKIVGLVGLPHLAFQISGANNEGHLLFIQKVEQPPADYTIFIDWANDVGIDSVGRKTDRNDLIDVAARFRNPPERNRIRLSQLRDRIDPWYYHPNYAALIRRLKQPGYKWYRLDEVFSMSPSLYDPRNFDEKATLRYIEKGDVDVERGVINSYSEQTVKTLPNRATFILQYEDVLFPTIYDSMRGIAIVPREYNGAVCTNRFFVLRHNPQRISLEFAKHFFTKPEILALLKRECSGEINPGIGKDPFFNLTVPLPEPDEQTRILEGVHTVEKEKRRLFAELSKLDRQIADKFRECVPEVIANYEQIKIRRAEFIGDVKVTEK